MDTPLGEIFVNIRLDDKEYRKSLKVAEKAAKDSAAKVQEALDRTNTKRAAAAITGLEGHFKKLSKLAIINVRSFQKTLNTVNTSKASRAVGVLQVKVLKAVAVMSAAVSAFAIYGTFKLTQFFKSAVLLTSRYDVLGVVMRVVGTNAKYAYGEMKSFQHGLESTGISAVEARQSLIRVTQAQLDLTQTAKLARIAQDAAVIGQINSSEAFQRMIYGIQTGSLVVLRTIGIVTSFEQGYKKLAKQLGKIPNDLTMQEKATARMNQVMLAGQAIAGTYEAAMTKVGKKLYSLQRYYDNLKVLVGQVFQPAFVVIIDNITAALKALNKYLVFVDDSIAKLGEYLEFKILKVIKKIKAVDFAAAWDKANVACTGLYETLKMLKPLLAWMSQHIKGVAITLGVLLGGKALVGFAHFATTAILLMTSLKAKVTSFAALGIARAAAMKAPVAAAGTGLLPAALGATALQKHRAEAAALLAHRTTAVAKGAAATAAASAAATAAAARTAAKNATAATKGAKVTAAAVAASNAAIASSAAKHAAAAHAMAEAGKVAHGALLPLSALGLQGTKVATTMAESMSLMSLSSLGFLATLTVITGLTTTWLLDVLGIKDAFITMTEKMTDMKHIASTDFTDPKYRSATGGSVLFEQGMQRRRKETDFYFTRVAGLKADKEYLSAMVDTNEDYQDMLAETAKRLRAVAKATLAADAAAEALAQTVKKEQLNLAPVLTQWEKMERMISHFKKEAEELATIVKKEQLNLAPALTQWEKMDSALDDYFKKKKELDKAEKKADKNRLRDWTKTNEVMLARWENFVNSFQSGMSDGFYKILAKQEDAWSGFCDSIKEVFLRALADMVAEAAMKNFAIPILQGFVGPNTPTAQWLGNNYGGPGGGINLGSILGGISSFLGVGAYSSSPYAGVGGGQMMSGLALRGTSYAAANTGIGSAAAGWMNAPMWTTTSPVTTMGSAAPTYGPSWGTGLAYAGAAWSIYNSLKDWDKDEMGADTRGSKFGSVYGTVLGTAILPGIGTAVGGWLGGLLGGLVDNDATPPKLFMGAQARNIGWEKGKGITGVETAADFMKTQYPEGRERYTLRAVRYQAGDRPPIYGPSMGTYPQRYGSQYVYRGAAEYLPYTKDAAKAVLNIREGMAKTLEDLLSGVENVFANQSEYNNIVNRHLAGLDLSIMMSTEANIMSQRTGWGETLWDVGKLSRDIDKLIESGDTIKNFEEELESRLGTWMQEKTEAIDDVLLGIAVDFGYSTFEKLTEAINKVASITTNIFSTAFAEAINVGGDFHVFEATLKAGVYNSVLDGVTTAFGASSAIQIALQPFLFAMDQAVLESTKTGVFDISKFEKLMTPELTNFIESIDSFAPAIEAGSALMNQVAAMLDLSGPTAVGPTYEVPHYDKGTYRVPYDQLAFVHRGENITPANETPGETGNTYIFKNNGVITTEEAGEWFTKMIRNNNEMRSGDTIMFENSSTAGL